MHKYGNVFYILILIFFLSGCGISSVWTGASLVYNRHNVYRTMDDYQLSLRVRRLLLDDERLKQKNCALDLAVLNGDVLVAGHLPDESLRNRVNQRLASLDGYRELFVQIAIDQSINNGIMDAWITTKIRSQIIADAGVDPNTFKIITSDRIVYVMGDVKPAEARRVLAICRGSRGVKRVVKLLRYYNLSETPSK